jgi:hypothetical protein
VTAQKNERGGFTNTETEPKSTTQTEQNMPDNSNVTSVEGAHMANRGGQFG